MRLSFTEHPASVGETYTEHMAMAASFGAAMLVAGIACLVHAVLPFLFIRTGSRTITALYDRMVVHRDRRMRTDTAAATSPVFETASPARR